MALITLRIIRWNHKELMWNWLADSLRNEKVPFLMADFDCGADGLLLSISGAGNGGATWRAPRLFKTHHRGPGLSCFKGFKILLPADPGGLSSSGKWLEGLPGRTRCRLSGLGRRETGKNLFGAFALRNEALQPVALRLFSAFSQNFHIFDTDIRKWALFPPLLSSLMPMAEHLIPCHLDHL